MLVSRDSDRTAEEIRWCVRHVRMRQLGHFMMGVARVKGTNVSVSGAYGSDGLTMNASDFPEGFYDTLPVLPAELRELWARGGGWNSAGAEGPAIRAYVQAQIRAQLARS